MSFGLWTGYWHHPPSPRLPNAEQMQALSEGGLLRLYLGAETLSNRSFLDSIPSVVEMYQWVPFHDNKTEIVDGADGYSIDIEPLVREVDWSQLEDVVHFAREMGGESGFHCSSTSLPRSPRFRLVQ